MLLISGRWGNTAFEDRFHEPMGRTRLVEATGEVTLLATVNLGGETSGTHMSMVLIDPTPKGIEQLSSFAVQSLAVLRAPRGMRDRPYLEWLTHVTITATEKCPAIITAHTEGGMVYQYAHGVWTLPEDTRTIWPLD